MNIHSFSSVPSPSRIRVKFSRLGQARDLSHLEQIRELRTMVKAANLPYTVARCGKAEIPKMSFGPAISVGYESLAEYADIYLLHSPGLEEVFDKLKSVSEKGISALGVKRIPLHFPSIEVLVNVAEYEISGEAIQNCNDETIKRFLGRSEILMAKNKPGGQSYFIDARPLIMSMELKNSSTAHLMLRFGPKRNIKPERIIGEALEHGHSPALQVMRKELYWENSSGQLATP